jgi:hypothetical protein
MKRILKTTPPPTDFILQTQLPDNPIIGFQTRQGLVEKGFIQQYMYDPRQCLLRLAPITSGQLFRGLPADFCVCVLNHPDLDYFLFETEKELLLWLAE